MIACKPTSTPIDQNSKLREARDEPTTNKEIYQRLVQRLIYMLHTSPNIAPIEGVLSQLINSPKEIHL